MHIQRARHAKHAAEGGDIAAGRHAGGDRAVLNIALFNYRNGCRRGQISACEHRVDLVDGIEILWTHKVIPAAVAVVGRCRIRGRGIDDVPAMGGLVPGRLARRTVVGLRGNLVESLDPRHHGDERGRNLRILPQCGVFAAPYTDVVQLGVEGFAHLAGGGLEVDHAGIVQHTANFEAVRLEPR